MIPSPSSAFTSAATASNRPPSSTRKVKIAANFNSSQE